MTSNDVPAALNARLATLSHPIQSENARAEGDTALFLRATWLPGRPSPLGMGQGKRLVGIFQVDVNGKRGAGESAIRAVVEELVELFPMGDALQVGTGWVRFENTYPLGGRPEDNRYVIPVRIQVRADIEEGQP